MTLGVHGGNELGRTVDREGWPLFVDDSQRMVQRSRVVPGLYWEISQVTDVNNPAHPRYNPRAVTFHDMQHIPEPTLPGKPSKGSTFAGEPGQSPMLDARTVVYAGRYGYVAAGDDGMLHIDMTTPAEPGSPVELITALAPGPRGTAMDVIVSHLPGQTWVLVADASGALVGLSKRARAHSRGPGR